MNLTSIMKAVSIGSLLPTGIISLRTSLLAIGLAGCGNTVTPVDVVGEDSPIVESEAATDVFEDVPDARDAAVDTFDACATDTTACGTTCVDLNSNIEHCGACGNRCEPAQRCESGRCTGLALRALRITPNCVFWPVEREIEMQLNAIGTFSDGSERNVNTMVRWSSGNETAIRVSNNPADAGTIRTVALYAAPGVDIYAEWGSLRARTPVFFHHRGPVRFEISPTMVSLPVGSTQQFTATGYDLQNNPIDLTSWREILWQINPALGTISRTGLLTPSSPGTAELSATLRVPWPELPENDCWMRQSTAITITP